MSPEKSDVDRFKIQLEKLQIPTEKLQSGLKGFVARKKFPADITEKLNTLIDTDAALAVITISELNPHIVSPRSHRRDNDIRKELLAHSSDKKILYEAASPLMPLGTAAHCLREMLDILPLDTIIKNSHHELIIEDNQVLGFQNIAPSENFQQNAISFEDPTKISINSNPNSSKINSLKTLFEFPLPAPKPDESPKDWVLNQLQSALKNIKIEDRDWPSKPHDIEKILCNGESKVALVSAIEICHYIFDNYGQMGVAAAINSHLEISTASIEQFRALNWLSVASNIVNLNREVIINQKDDAILIELPVGRIPIITGDIKYPELTLNGGEIDTLVLRLPNAKSKFGELSPKKFSQFLEQEFNNQALKYHEKDNDGHVTKNKLGRNLSSCFHLLSHHFGEDFIDHLEIVIKDYKFIGGDGGWKEAYDKDHLPVPKHELQIRDYLILTLGQLYLNDKRDKQAHQVKENLKNPQENFIPNQDAKIPAVTLDELLEFGRKKNLFGRITGELCYQIPGQEIIKTIKSDDFETWQRWGKAVISERVKQYPEYQQRLYWTLLKNAVYSKDELDKSYREINKVPESISWCKYLHQNYILIKELSQDILDQKVTVERSVIYKDGVVVLWLKLKDQHLRLAINQHGNFTAIGFKDSAGAVNGSLSSNIEMVGVRQRNDLLLKMFQKNIVDNLNPKNLIYENRINPSKNIIGPNGKILDLVAGKPIVATVNHMNGSWYLNTRLLQEIALDGSIHTVYLHKLAEMLSREHIKNQPVMCPLPTHSNRTSSAAYLYSDHIKCFGLECGETIRITDTKGHFIKHRPMEAGDVPTGYREVTPERQRSIKSFFNLIINLNQNPEIVNYLIHLRGLSPSEIGLDNFGYYPLDLSTFISKIADHEFGKMGAISGLENKLNKIDPELKSEPLFKYAADKHDLVFSLRRLVNTFPEIREKIRNNFSEFTIEDLSKLLKNYKIMAKEELDNTKKQCLGYYVSRSENLQKTFTKLVLKYPEIESDLNQLSFSQMEQWHQRGLVGADKNSHDYMGGRIIFKTKWISGSDLQPGNICARGISDLDKKELFEGEKHRKAFLGPLKKRKDHDLYTHPTPPGIWLPSPDKFMETIASTKKIVLLEGPITTASFVNIFPEYRDNTAAVIGFPVYQLTALLKWFGVCGYESKDQHFSKNLDIQEIILGTDFDKGGTDGFIHLSEYLHEIFPQLIITPIHNIVSDSHPSKKFLRPYNPELYKEGGPLEKEPKVDWNDILLVLNNQKKSWLK